MALHGPEALKGTLNASVLICKMDTIPPAMPRRLWDSNEPHGT